MTGLDLDVSTDEPVIRFTRFVAAPPSLVFAMFTEPEHLRRWWGPREQELVTCDMDLRPGGAFRLVSRGPDGVEHPFSGEFLSVDEPKRLAMRVTYEPFPDAWWVDDMTFEEAEGGTLLAGTTTFASMDAREGHLAAGMEGGMRESYERLDELAASLVG